MARLPAVSFLLLAVAAAAVAQNNNVDTLLDAIVQVTVGKGPGRSPNVGTGFVVAVNGRRTTIITARHLFYPNEKNNEPAFTPDPSVVFHADPQHPKKATLLPKDSAHAGISVLEVLDAGLGTLPRFQIRMQPLSRSDHVRVMGSDEDWSSPEMAIASLAYTDRTDWFTYSGTGLTPGYSGSPVVDLNGLLVGVHQGETDGGRKLGWAQRIQEVDETLVRVLGVTPDFGGSAIQPPPVTVTRTPTAPATGTLRDGRDGLKYVWIGPGKFMMGCSAGDSECFPEEKPAHSVTISKGFWMGQTPVTVAAWKRYATASGAELPAKDDFGHANLNGFDDAPVVAVKWDEADAYCGWAGSLRLPTEAEWEYAARAGTTGARYEDLEKIAMTGSLGPVPSKAPNAWKLYNMLGSLWQWVADRYDAGYYKPGSVTDPLGPATGDYRALRGGSWVSGARFVRASNRYGDPPADRGDGIGVRCVGE